VPLNPTGSVEFVLSVEHGVKSFTNTLAWQSLNLLDAESLALRDGDALLLTAVPAGATNGTVTLSNPRPWRERPPIDSSGYTIQFELQLPADK